MDGEMACVLIPVGMLLLFAIGGLIYNCTKEGQEAREDHVRRQRNSNKISCPKCGELVELNNQALQNVLSVVDPMFAVARSTIRNSIECPNCGNRWLP